MAGQDLLNQRAAAAGQPCHKNGAEAAVAVPARALRQAKVALDNSSKEVGLKKLAHPGMPDSACREQMPHYTTC